MKKIKVIAILLFLALSILKGQCAIKITPSYLEFSNKGVNKDYMTSSFEVSGAKDETIRFKLYPVNFEYDTKGHFIDLSQKEYDNPLYDNIKFFPSEFTCKDGMPQKVRVTVANIKNLPQGETKLMLFLEDVDTKEVLLNKAGNKTGGKILVKTRVGVPVFFDKDKYSKSGKIDSMTFDKINNEYNCAYKISSTGNSKIRYQGYLQISKDKKLIKRINIPSCIVEGGKYLEKSRNLDLKDAELEENGIYDVKLILKYSDENGKEKIIKKETRYNKTQTI